MLSGRSRCKLTNVCSFARYALWSLSLSIDESNQKTLLDESAVQALVNALSAVSDVTREQATAALSRLANNNIQAQTEIAKSGSIAPLIRIVQQEEGHQQDSMVAQTCAAAALADIAVVPGNRDEIVKLGGIKPLTALLYDSEDGQPRSCQQSASAALARLATSHEILDRTGGKDVALSMEDVARVKQNAVEIARAGAIGPLVLLLDGERGLPAQQEAAGALFAIADDSGQRHSIETRLRSTIAPGPCVSLRVPAPQTTCAALLPTCNQKLWASRSSQATGLQLRRLEALGLLFLCSAART